MNTHIYYRFEVLAYLWGSLDARMTPLLPSRMRSLVTQVPAGCLETSCSVWAAGTFVDGSSPLLVVDESSPVSVGWLFAL